MRLFLTKLNTTFILVIFVMMMVEVGTVYGQINPNVTSFVTPLKQIQLGTSPESVKCNQNLQLVIKTEDGSPACVKDTSIGKLVRQGWWVWNDKVGDTVVNTPGKKNFDNKTCAISETMSSIVGTNGFVKDDLPANGITYKGADLKGLVGEVIQFAIPPNSNAQIVFTYDFNSYPGSNCKITTKDVLTTVNPGTPNTPISDLLSSPDIIEVNQTMVRNDMMPLGNSGDVMVKLTSAEDVNDHVEKVIYQIVSKPTSQIGKSYFVGFWWHSAVVVTVGNNLYNGTALSGPRFS